MLNEHTEQPADKSTTALDPNSWSAGILGRRRLYSLLAGWLVVWDAVVAFCAAALAYVMYAGWPASIEHASLSLWALPGELLAVTRSAEFAPFVPLLAVAPLVTIFVFVLVRAHRIRPADLRPFGALGAIARGALLSTVVLAVLAVLLNSLRHGGTWQVTVYIYLAYLGLLLLFGIILVHAATLIFVLFLQAVGIGRVRVATVAPPDVASHLARVLSLPASAYDFAGNIESGPPSGASPSGIPPLGVLSNLKAIINEHDLNQLILSSDPHGLTTDERLQVAQTCSMMGVELKVVAPFHPFFRADGQPEFLGDIALLHLERAGLYATAPQLLKRLMDITVSAFVLLAVSPILLVTAVLIKLDSPGPVLFRQKRIGLNGRAFTMLKFRSMRTDSDASQHKEYLKQLIKGNAAHDVDKDGKPIYKIAADPRITKVGRFIRATSIDELPQLLNVLQGGMSLVGPRPPVQYEVDEYEDWHMKRLNIRPGITGLWQVSGRSRLSFHEMVQLDILYIEQWSLWLDIKILLRTVPVVLKIGQAY